MADIDIILHIGLLCLSIPIGGNSLKRSVLCLMLCVSLLCGILGGCSQTQQPAEPAQPVQPPKSVEEIVPLPEAEPISAELGDYGLAAAVLYDSHLNSQNWQDIYDLLSGQDVGVIRFFLVVVDDRPYCRGKLGKVCRVHVPAVLFSEINIICASLGTVKVNP